MKHDPYYLEFLTKNPYPRTLRALDFFQGSAPFYVYNKGKKLINFSSSDYLGLSQHPELIARCEAYATTLGVGSSASRLVTGNFSVYQDIEQKLAESIGKPAALILGSGYQTNLSVLNTLLHQQLFNQQPRVFCDRLCHASMIEAVRYSTHVYRFAHNTFDHLIVLLKKYANSGAPLFILAESIYSMEGDASNLAELVEIADHYQAFLYIDDAHAVGVYGNKGWGKTVAYADQIDIIMGTFSKALGCYGGFIGCSIPLKEYLVNQCKGLIYSTGLPPPILGAIAAVIELLPKLDKERDRLITLSKSTRDFFIENDISIGQSTTHIIPWIIGDAVKTRYASQLLEGQGILGTAIQPPSIPTGKSRIRFCLSAMHSDEDIEALWRSVKLVRDQL